MHAYTELREVIMRWLSGLLLLLIMHLVSAQNPAPPATAAQPPAALQLSPQAAYEEAARPLDIVRRESVNWSDAELAALDVAISQAKGECQARTAGQFAGEDLLAYARLCAFAQMWPQVQQAGTNYLVAYNAAKPEEQKSNFPNLSMAFDYVVQASLHQGNSTNAFGTTQAMLRTVPYDDLASDAVNATVRYVQLIQTDEALALLKQRQPELLALLRNHVPQVVGPSVSLEQPARPAMPIHTLYADAIALPAMLQFANQPEAAASSIAELEAALPANLSSDDAILTAASRRQYRLLGSPLPGIPASAWLLDPSAGIPGDLNRKYGVASIFLLFPDWCAQCIKMRSQFNGVATRLNPDGVYFYVLLAQADPKPPDPVAAPKLPTKPSSGSFTRTAKSGTATSAKAATPHVDLQLSVAPVPSELLMGTSTLIVPPETIDTFVATDFPLLIATDHEGIVRYLQTAPANVLVRGGLAEQVADRVTQQWPPPHK
jgi:hypothetical protein